MDKNLECTIKTVKGKQGKKQHVNIAMTVLFIFLMKMGFLNPVWHEVIGVGLFVLFFLHHGSNFRYTLQILKRFFSPRLKAAVKVGLILDLVLLVVLGGLIFSALVISNVLFQFTAFDPYWPEVAAIHKGLAVLSVILFGLHIGLHWSMIMHHGRTFLKITRDHAVRVFFLRVVSVAIAVFGLFSFGSLGMGRSLSDLVRNAGSLTVKLVLQDADTGSGRIRLPFQVASLASVVPMAEVKDDEDDEDEPDEPDEEDSDELDGVTSGTPNGGAQPVDGVTSGTPDGGSLPVDGVTSGTPNGGSASVDAVTSSTIQEGGLSVDGATSGTPKGGDGTVDAVTRSSVKSVPLPSRYRRISSPGEYAGLILRYVSVLGSFVFFGHYASKVLHKADPKASVDPMDGRKS